jgi:two-component system, chemotaxis family, CheB/CheR fusion protein
MVSSRTPVAGRGRHFRQPFTFDSPVQDSGLVSLRALHVMLVEDNVDARNIIRRVLEHCGAMVTVAETARAGLRKLRAMPGRPHVLVSDIALPGQDGYWLLRQVRALGRLATLPAIAITAHRNEYDREETLAAGFQDYFQKPLDLVAFSRAIARLAGR